MPASPSPNPARPSNHEVENENQRPASSEGESSGGEAPRPATEPRGTKDSANSPETRTDPGSGEAKAG